MSLDGFIAGTKGEYDWIVGDSAFDFPALYREFDTAVMGRKTFDIVAAAGDMGTMPGIEVIAFSKTLPATTRAGVRIVNDDPIATVAALKARRGKDIWLFGGGALFRSLLDAGLVDTVEVAVMPVVLGAGIPLLPPGTAQKLELADHRILPASGIVMLAYTVAGSPQPAPRIRYVKKPRAKARKRPAKKARKRRP
jgi:dihydrofolate reductase